MMVLQVAVDAFYYYFGCYPTATGDHGRIAWHASADGSAFIGNFLVSIPDSDAACNWHIDSSGWVYPALAGCPCGDFESLER